MSIAKHPDNLYKIQVTSAGVTSQVYSKTMQEAEEKNKAALSQAAESGSFVYQRKKKLAADEFDLSTMPLITVDGCPRFLQIIKKVGKRKSGEAVYFSVGFKCFGNRRDRKTKAFSISKNGFDVAFNKAFEFGSTILSLSDNQKDIWLSGREALRAKYQEHVKKRGVIMLNSLKRMYK